MLDLLFQMIIKELKTFFSNKQNIVIAFVLPLILISVGGFVFTNDIYSTGNTGAIDISIVDHEKSIYSKMLLEHFKNNKVFSKLVHIRQSSKEEATEDFLNNETTAIIEIPEDFSNSLMYCENKPFTITLNGNHPMKSIIIKSLMNSYGKYISSVQLGSTDLYSTISTIGLSPDVVSAYHNNISYDLVSTALDRTQLFSLHPIRTVPSSSSFEYFFIAVFTLFLLYIGLLGTNSFIQEKSNGCLMRILAAPTPSFFIIISKFIALFIFCLAQLSILTLPIVFFYKTASDVNWGHILFFMTLTLTFIIGFSLFLGACFASEETVNIFGHIVIFLFGIMGGSFIPLSMMPYSMEKWAMFTPNYWIIRGFLFLINGYSLRDILSPIIFLSCLSVIFFIGTLYRLQRMRRGAS